MRGVRNFAIATIIRELTAMMREVTTMIMQVLNKGEATPE
jgi:hypothetical protein